MKIKRLIIILFVILISPSFIALSDEIVNYRQEMFQKNKQYLREIYKAIGKNDFIIIEEKILKVEDWANKMVDYFPPESYSRSASEDIWDNFEDFKIQVQNHVTAIENFKIAVLDKDIDKVNSLFNDFSNTCKACHKKYKN
ncbi:MAG: hypothetical protein CMP38_05490 [Rickettsiales bacterium]|nr:hypothetical protein [Rickettsiales bacterium]|tara:strand:+ start:90 stop:512 length:423 start_codon:yes stop_codon:yes gene_type:complete